MAAPVITNVGYQRLLRYATDATDPAFYLSLFTNDATINASTVLGDLTEMSGNGYANIAVTFPNPFVESGEAITIVAKSFTGDGGAPDDIYGWFLSSETGTYLIAAQKYDSPVTWNTNTILVACKLTYGPCA